MSRFVLPLIGVVVLVGFFFIGLDGTRDPSALPSQFVGKPAPEFDLPAVIDPQRRVSNADLRGQVSLVNVWATWCVGCRAEHEFLNQLAQQGEYPIYGINWRDNRATALEWLERFGNPYVKSGFDEDGRVGIDWGVYGAPETFLISAEGEVVYRFTGPLSWALWEREFEPRIERLNTQ